MKTSKTSSAAERTAELTAELTAQLAARDILVPFAARLLSGAPPSTAELNPLAKLFTPNGLPWGRPERLSREAAEGLAEVARLGVFDWLAELGARPVSFVDAARGRLKKGRVWEHPAWASLALPFSGESITLLIAAHQLLRPCKGQEPLAALRRLTLRRDGDLLLHALVYERLRALNGRDLKLSDEARASFCARSPLCALLDHDAPASEGLAGRLRALLDRPALAALWPWLARHVGARWRAREGRGWPSKELIERLAAAPPRLERGSELIDRRRVARGAFMARVSAEAARVEALFEAAGEERLAPLAPLIWYAARIPTSRAGHAVSEVTSVLLRELPLSERDALHAPILSLLSAPERLAARAARVRALSPVEREPEEALLLNMYEASGVEPLLPTFARERRALSPEIG